MATMTTKTVEAEDRAEVRAAGVHPASPVVGVVSPNPQGAENPAIPNPAADNLEEVYFEGTPALRSIVGKTIFWLLIATAIAIAPFVVEWKGWVKGGLPIWVNLVCIAIGVLIIMVPVLAVRSVRYRVTNYRIRFDRGLLGRTIDTLELWHVDDIKLYQSILGRILGVGNVIIISTDNTTPTMVIRGIPNPRPLFDLLEQRIIAVKRQRGVVKLDM